MDLFHTSYRTLSDAESRAMIKIKAAANNLVDEFAIIEPSREKSIAVTKIEEAVMWAVKALTK